jgi:hypothetical protein
MGRKIEQRLSYCLKHQDRPTDTRCAACLKPICEECTVVTESGKFCSQECYEKRLASVERVRVLKEEEERERVPRMIRGLISFMLKLLFLFGLFFLFTLLPKAWTAPVYKVLNGWWKVIKSVF